MVMGMEQREPTPAELARMVELLEEGLEAGALGMSSGLFTSPGSYAKFDEMLATLAETFPGIDWPKQGAYFFSRVAQHGKRRAEEMREVARTVREAGFDRRTRIEVVGAGHPGGDAVLRALADTIVRTVQEMFR